MSGQRSLGCITPGEPQFVSISLSSGFSFQAPSALLTACDSPVSISLLSGFSFQGNILIPVFAHEHVVSISLSSGFSFQGQSRPLSPPDAPLFPSRYRAASHFRQSLTSGRVVQLLHVSISLSSGFSFQDSIQFETYGGPYPMFQSRYRAASHFRRPKGIRLVAP